MKGEQTNGEPTIRPAGAPACTIPPEGWSCTRIKGHSGPCAAVKHETTKECGQESVFDKMDKVFKDFDDTMGVAFGCAEPGAPHVPPRDAVPVAAECACLYTYDEALVHTINEVAKREHRHKLWHRIVELTFILAMLALTMFFMGKAHGATVSWTHDGLNTTGYKVMYGTSATSLTNVASIDSPTARATEIVLPAAGRWYFAVKAVNGAVESPSSPVVAYDDPGTAPPPATPASPTSPAVIGRVVFQIIQQSDRLVFLPVGTVSTAVACKSEFPVGEYHVVPRAAVTWYGTVQPLVVVTRCN